MGLSVYRQPHHHTSTRRGGIDILFRINQKNYLLHMIDYFTADELSNMHYLIISAGVKNRGLLENVAKNNYLYPTSETVADYVSYGDMDLLRKTYGGELKESENSLYGTIIEPILKYHHNIVLVCTESEDPYIDVLVEYLDKEFAMKTVDLNELFVVGETSILYLDRKLIHDNVVEITRSVAREQYRSMASSDDGRLNLIEMMSKSEKIKKLKELGVRVGNMGNKELTVLLTETWVGELH